MEKIYNKLVRDKIPEIILKDNAEPVTRILEVKEYKKELEKKLYEEYKEMLETKTQEERIEELADVLEVVRSLAKVENKAFDDLIVVADKKREKRGGFDDKIFLVKVIKDGEDII